MYAKTSIVMAILNMYGPYDLTPVSINANVTQISPGNYALGRLKTKYAFLVFHIGRSDTDIRNKLLSWVGKTKHALFKFNYASSPKAAFLRECENWHDFKPSENPNHPDKPIYTDWKCPRCNAFN